MDVTDSGERRGVLHPRLGTRVAVYGIALLLIFIALRTGERFGPIVQKLAEHDNLPPLPAGFAAFVRLNASWLHLPEVVGVLLLLGGSEWSIALAQGRAWGKLCSWLCVVAVGLTGIAVLLIVMYTLSSVQVVHWSTMVN